MIAEALVHRLDDRACCRVGLEPRGPRQLAGAVPAEGLAVVGVPIPLTADRLRAVHEHIVLPAHGAVEMLHDQAAPVPGPGCEAVDGAIEVAVLADLQRDGLLGSRLTQLGEHPVITRLDQDKPLGVPSWQILPQQPTKARPPVRGRVHGQGVVVDRDPIARQGVAKVAHGREEQHQALLMGGDVGGLVGELRHPDRIAFRIEIVEGGRVPVELIAGNEDQMAQAVSPHCPASRRPAGSGPRGGRTSSCASPDGRPWRALSRPPRR